MAIHWYTLIDPEGKTDAFGTDGPIRPADVEKRVGGPFVTRQLGGGYQACINEIGQELGLQRNSIFPDAFGTVLIGQTNSAGKFCGLSAAQLAEVKRNARETLFG